MFDDDLATLFADPLITDPASIGRASTRGTFAHEDVLESDGQGGMITVSRQVLTIKAGSLAGLPAPGTPPGDVNITIKGQQYRVRDVRHASPGVLKVIVA